MGSCTIHRHLLTSNPILPPPLAAFLIQHTLFSWPLFGYDDDLLLLLFLKRDYRRVYARQKIKWIPNRGQSPTLTHPPNYYDVLGLSKDASEQDVVKAWRKAVLLHHPDKQISNGANVATTSSNVDIRLINEAKWILSDVMRRKEWEQSYLNSGEQATAKVETTPRVSYDISLSDFTPHYRRENDQETDDEAEPAFYSHSCRCSSEFIITHQDLEDGVDVIGCGGCGEWVRVGYEVLEDEGDGTRAV